MLLHTPVLPWDTTKSKELISSSNCKFYKKNKFPFNSVSVVSYLVEGNVLKQTRSIPLKNLATAYAGERRLTMLTIHLKIHGYLNSTCIFAEII